jgi:hypothetical protein
MKTSWFSYREARGSPKQLRGDARHIPLRAPIAHYDTHHEGSSPRCVKFPSGPHHYGRLLAIDAGRSHCLLLSEEPTELVMTTIVIGIAIVMNS